MNPTFTYKLGSRTGDVFIDALRIFGEVGICGVSQVQALAVAVMPAFHLHMRIRDENWADSMTRVNILNHLFMAHRIGDQIRLANDLGKNAMTLPGSKLAATVAMATRNALIRRMVAMQQSRTDLLNELRAKAANAQASPVS